ncbi:MAG: hypothetical protein DHS20C17_09870 [Cyclobacteriaceae bacterium]|nr:MAG: hypothetical protein DHS20C17_09870 [Cyclobacteriaceae bacterium]
MACSDDSEQPVIDCNSSGPKLTLSAENISCGSLGGGTIQVHISDGEGAMKLTITPDTGVLDNNIYSELPEGEYTISVSDDNDCVAQSMASISIESLTVSYQNDVKPIIETVCTISGCHNGDNNGSYGQNRNWLVFTNVQNNAFNIKTRINRDPSQPGHMPKEGSLSQDEIALITCWVDGGAPDN